MKTPGITIDPTGRDIAPAQMVRAQGLAATWAAALPAGTVWHEALRAATHDGVG